MIAEVKGFIERNPVLLSKDELKTKPEQKQEHNKERRSSIKPPGSPKSNKGDVKFNAGTKDKKSNKEFEKKRDETKTKISSDTLKVKALGSLESSGLDDSSLFKRLNECERILARQLYLDGNSLTSLDK